MLSQCDGLDYRQNILHAVAIGELKYLSFKQMQLNMYMMGTGNRDAQGL